jgi:hypothetical protein
MASIGGKTRATHGASGALAAAGAYGGQQHLAKMAASGGSAKTAAEIWRSAMKTKASWQHGIENNNENGEMAKSKDGEEIIASGEGISNEEKCKRRNQAKMWRHQSSKIGQLIEA